jgi:hypothetical protein
MFKKTVVFSLAVVWLLVGVCTIASAAQNVGNTSQKGSVLIFPKIVNFVNDNNATDTIIQISNDYSRGVMVKCYWVDSDQQIQDFMFLVTITQPVWFRASDGLGTGSYWGDPDASNEMTVPPFFPNSVGELKCWAVNFEGASQINWNHLYGTATVIDYRNLTAYQYNSFNFTARGFASAGTEVGTGGDIVLSGANKQYDACPQYLLANFFSYAPTNPVEVDGQGQVIRFNKTDLTMVPCKQDLRQDRVPTCTKAKFDIWNENETKYTGAYQCFKCWFEGYLNEIGTILDINSKKATGFGGEKFTYAGLHTAMGRVRASGVASTVCNNVFMTASKPGPIPPAAPGVDRCKSQVSSPLIGITTTQIRFTGKDELTAATTVGSGTGELSHILWDTQGVAPEAPAR